MGAEIPLNVTDTSASVVESGILLADVRPPARSVPKIETREPRATA
jgi:hypothetical protein